MGRFLLIIVILCLAFTAAYGAARADINPDISADGRYVVFERHYSDIKEVETVVVDTESKISRVIAGPLYDLLWKDKLIFAGAGPAHVSIFRPSGQVVHSAWRTGTNSRAVPREWESVGGLRWMDKGVIFTAVERGRSQSWFMDALSGSIDLAKNVDPAPPSKRQRAQNKDNILEVNSSGGLILRGPGTDKLIRLGSAIQPKFSPNAASLVLVDDIGQRGIRARGESKSNFVFSNIYVISRDGQGLRSITKTGGRSPVYHPSGAGIAYISSTGNIEWAGVDTPEKRVLVADPGPVERLRWHPDGKWLLAQVVEGNEVSWKMFNPPSRKLKSFGVPLKLSRSGVVSLSPTGRRALVMRQGARYGEADIIGGGDIRTISFEYPTGQSLGFEPSANWSTDERTVVLSIGGNISLIHVGDGYVEPISGRLF